MNSHQPTLDTLIAKIRKNTPNADTRLIERAYAFAEQAHRGQLRMSGEPYITHPLQTAIHLADLRIPENIIAAGLLHDVAEDTPVTLEEIRSAFGDDIANMINGICKVGKIKYRGMDRYVENLRKMFLAIAKDVRVIIIKFADRLHNLETLEHVPQKKAYRIALESLEIYAPIANRLGMGEMKGRLEDAAFRWVLPKEYAWVKDLARQSSQMKQPQIEKLIRETREELAQAQIHIADVHGRQKHLYSLYRKLLKNDRDISKIYDLTAIRCVLPTTADCYAALGVIHNRWTPLKGRIKDYISQPKPNGYQSLHTTIFYDRSAVVEFQFRTEEMHKLAEFGIAAHWAYDEHKLKEAGAKRIQSMLKDHELEWIDQIAEVQSKIQNPKTFLNNLEEMKLDAFHDRIFVYTPNGDVIELPEESTPIDFAYAIHTEIGNTCSAAKVNDAIHPLDKPLKSGDIVEIITDKSRKGPNPDWIRFAKTRNARSRIRQFARSGLSKWIQGVLPSIKKK